MILSCVNTGDCSRLFIFLLNACRVTIFNKDDWFPPGRNTCMMKRDFYFYLLFFLFKYIYKQNKKIAHEKAKLF
jgi:hypothetical protein